MQERMKLVNSIKAMEKDKIPLLGLVMSSKEYI